MVGNTLAKSLKKDNIFIYGLAFFILFGVGIFLATDLKNALYLLAGIIALFATITVSLHPEIGLYLIIFSVPFDQYAVDFGVINLSATNFLIITTVASLVLRALFRRKRTLSVGLRQKSLMRWTLIIYFFATLVSLGQSQDILESARALITITGCTLTWFLVTDLIYSPTILRRTMLCVVLSCAMVAAVGIIQAFLPGFLIAGKTRYVMSAYDLSVPRVTSTYFDPNIYGSYLIVGAPIALSCILVRFSSKVNKLLLIVLLASISVGILISYSGGAWVGGVTGLLFFIYLLWFLGRSKSCEEHRSLLLPLIVFASSLVMIDLVCANFEFLTSSFLTGWIFSAKEESVQSRLYLSRVAVDAFYNHPFLGIGLKSFSYIPKDSYHTVSHNSYLTILAEGGLMRFLPLISFIALIIYSSLKAASLSVRKSDKMIYAGVISSLIGVLVSATFFNMEDVKYLWLLLGIAGSIPSLYDQETICKMQPGPFSSGSSNNP